MRLTRAVSLSSLLLGCGGTVSLDEPGSSSGEPVVGAGPFGPDPATTSQPTGGDGFEEGPLDGSEGGQPKLDVSDGVPLPPGACEPDCQVTLTEAWTYTGPTNPAPVEPHDRVAVIVGADHEITVAEQRQGEITLAHLESNGQEVWTLPLELPCAPCRLVELGLHPSGDLLLAGHGIDENALPAAFVARIELGGPSVVWATSTALRGGPGIVPRAGSLVHYAGFLFQPVHQGSGTDGVESLDLFAYDGTSGAWLKAQTLATGLVSGDSPPPLATYDSTGALVIAHSSWTGTLIPGGTVRWLSPTAGEVLATAPRPEPSMHMAAGPDGRTLTLAEAPPPATAVYLDSGLVREPEQWDLLYPLDSSGHPTLAVDGYGHAYVLARVARGEPERDVGLQLLRWTEEGQLVWKLVLPVVLERVDEPVALAVTVEDDLVLAGFAYGARQVRMLWPGCDCG